MDRILELFFFTFCFVFMPICIADNASLSKVSKSLKEFRATFGYTPTETDYYRLIFEEGVDLTPSEQGILWSELVRLQQPSITLENIREILDAKVKSIKSFKCEFNLLQDNKAQVNDVLNGKTSYIYVVKHPMFFVETRHVGVPDGLEEHQLFSYDGNDDLVNVVNLNTPLPNAGIATLTNRSSGFCPFSPFAQSMLYDTASFDSAHPGFDFALFFETFPGMVVFEKKEQYDGRECIIVADLSHRFLLDVQKDFALVKRTFYLHHYSNTPEGQKMMKRTLYEERSLGEMSDYGNGIWLPSKIDHIHYSPTGEVVNRSFIRCSNIEINNVSDAFWEKVIPDSAVVFDSVRGMSYMQSDSPSIDALLKETAKSKRVWIFKYISMALGLAMIIFALVAKYLAYRKRKNNP